MLYLLRHEETPLNVENRFRGSANPPLSADGKRAAERIYAQLPFEPERIVCDSMARTCQTAKIIANGKPIETDEGLRPWDIGAISGTKKTDAAMQAFNDKYVDHPGSRPPDGKSLNEFLRRWKSVYKKYLDAARGGVDILLVVHGSNVGAVLSGFRPVNLQGSIAQKPGTIIEVEEDGMPKFLETKLKKQYGAKSKIPFKIMNKIGAMRGNQETPKGVAMQAKHTMKLSKLARA